MAYESNAATTPEAVLSALYTFATTNGWTGVDNSLVGSKRTIKISKTAASGNTLAFEISNADIGGTNYSDRFEVIAGTSFSGTTLQNPHNVDIGQKVTAIIGTEGSAVGSQLFSNGDSLTCVFEYEANYFCVFTVGDIAKIGSWTGGQYAFSIRWYHESTTFIYQPDEDWHQIFCNEAVTSANGAQAGTMRANIDAADRWFANGNSPAGQGMTGLFHADLHLDIWMQNWFGRSESAFNSQILMLPVYTMIERTTGRYSWAGKLPDIMILNIERFDPKAEFTIGSDTWKVYPWIWKGLLISNPSSENFGFAVKKTV